MAPWSSVLSTYLKRCYFETSLFFIPSGKDVTNISLLKCLCFRATSSSVLLTLVRLRLTHFTALDMSLREANFAAITKMPIVVLQLWRKIFVITRAI